MLLYGAGGHAKIVLDCCSSNNIVLNTIFDDNENIKSFKGFKVIKYDAQKYPEEELIISVGNNKNRHTISKNTSHKFGKIIHPSSIISKSAQIKSGTVVFHNSTIQADASIGEHVIINTGSIVEHDCKIGDFAHIAPGTVLCGEVSIGEGTLIGANSVINPQVKIGKWCVIGSGSIVRNDIPDYSLVAGNSAKIIKSFNKNG